MSSALLFFVVREAIRTSRETAAHASAANDRTDTVRAPAFASTAQQVRVDSQPLQQTTPPAATKMDRAELRRRIDAGSPGTYMVDMLADRDSTLNRWPDRTIEPVRVWIQRGATVPDWSPELFRVTRAAFDEWGEVAQSVRFTFTVDSANADIHVNFADRVTDGTRLGVTTHRHNQDGWIVSADIVIATHDTAGVALASPVIGATARHEVGHALGLAHSRDRATIMYPESQTLVITGPDRATLKLLYTLPPGSVR